MLENWYEQLAKEGYEQYLHELKTNSNNTHPYLSWEQLPEIKRKAYIAFAEQIVSLVSEH